MRYEGRNYHVPVESADWVELCRVADGGGGEWVGYQHDSGLLLNTHLGHNSSTHHVRGYGTGFTGVKPRRDLFETVLEDADYPVDAPIEKIVDTMLEDIAYQREMYCDELLSRKVDDVTICAGYVYAMPTGAVVDGAVSTTEDIHFGDGEYEGGISDETVEEWRSAFNDEVEAKEENSKYDGIRMAELDGELPDEYYSVHLLLDSLSE